jgi:hypothetical protein
MITRLIFDFLNSGRQPGYALRLVRYTRLHPAECRAWAHVGAVEDAEHVVARRYFQSDDRAR